MPITLHTLAAHELGAALPLMDGVMQRAYRAPSFTAQLGWYTTAQPDALVVAMDGDVIVGTGCGIAYPDAGFGWIGLIGTEPAYERRGIGTVITERVAEILATHGCASALDASTAGRAVYERMGFVDHGPTWVLDLPEPSDRAHPRVVPITAADRAEVAAFDAAAFGGDRSRLLDLLLDSHPGRSGLVRVDSGAIVGMCIAQHVSVGPLVVDPADPDVLGELIAFAASLPWVAGGRVNVPPEMPTDALVALGCVPQRALRHMRRGIDVLPGRAEAYVGRISLGIG